ncbi:MAG: HAD family hydrolase [Ilumatobacteraceae bacterium]
MTEVDWSRFDAVLFDLDGVLTPTADVHERAWATMFDEFLASHGRPGEAPFSTADYHSYVDGRPRFDGVRTFLASRDITLADGRETDPPGDQSVGALGNRKNEVFNELLSTEGIAPYPGSVRLLDQLVADRKQMAVVSSSRNARAVLAASGLAPRFTVVADGLTLSEQHLAGKPAPDLFLAAARQLGVDKERSVVMEDALSGVAAGRAGPFGLVVGVDRGAGERALLDNGADLVVKDLAELVTHP